MRLICRLVAILIAIGPPTGGAAGLAANEADLHAAEAPGGWRRAAGYRGDDAAFGAAPIVLVAAADDRAAWRAARDANTAAAYRRYILLYPNGLKADEARRRLNRRAAAADGKAREQALDLNRAEREEVEFRLSRAGYRPGAINGTFDRDTRQAIRAYRRDAGLPRHAYLDRPMIRQLVRDTGGARSQGYGEDYSGAAAGFAVGALLLGGVILLTD